MSELPGVIVVFVGGWHGYDKDVNDLRELGTLITLMIGANPKI